MLQIERVEAVPFRVPLRERVGFATGVLDAAEHVLVRLTSTDGAVGVAEAIPRPMIHGETVGSVLAVLGDDLTPRLTARAWSGPEQLHAALASLIGNHTAKAAVELAFHDLLGVTVGVSCHRLLGGFTDRLAVSAILGYGSAEEVADQALQQRQLHGITAFKLKVGADVDRDVRTCTAVRAAVGEAAWIYVDGNHGYDVAAALRFLQATRELGLAWHEELVAGPMAKATLAQPARAVLVADESVPTAGLVGREVLDRRTHGVSLKVSRTGYPAAERIRSFCEVAGAPLVMGSQGESGLGTLACLAFAAARLSTSRFPAEYSYFTKLEGDLLVTGPQLRDGCLHVPDLPGIGAVIDQDRLRHHQVVRGA